MKYVAALFVFINDVEILRRTVSQQKNALR